MDINSNIIKIKDNTEKHMMKQYDFFNLPIVDLVNNIILDSIKAKASDIHFEPREKDLLIRIRIDGQLINFTMVPEAIKRNLVTRVKIIAGMNITETRLPQDGAVKSKLNNMLLDLRVSSLPSTFGEKIVVRILDYSMSLGGLETLGFSEKNLAKVKDLIDIPNGIILITGATGTGKSTTVYSMLQSLNTENTNIVTVEDPVEMGIEGLTQVQVNPEIGLTFGSALRSILRQDPDIIMIGEIRDDETAKIAVRASITGHLVLSTIHTNNSLNTIERLLDMDIERYLLGAALEGIISQNLARKLCPLCRRPKKTSEYEKKLIKKVLNIDIEQIYEPVGCPDCHDGYKGRLAIQEVLVLNQDIRDAITNNLRKDELRKLVYTDQTISMLQDGLQKVVEGLISMDEIMRIIDLENENDICSSSYYEKPNNKESIETLNINEKKEDYEIFNF